VEKIGGLKPKDFKRQGAKGVAETVMKELSKQTENISELERQKREVKGS